MNSTTEISYLHDVIASRDRYIVQIELELYRLRGILMSRDQQIHEMATMGYPHSSTTDSAEVSSAPIEIVTIVSTNATASSTASASTASTASSAASESVPIPVETVEAVETGNQE